MNHVFSNDKLVLDGHEYGVGDSPPGGYTSGYWQTSGGYGTLIKLVVV